MPGAGDNVMINQPGNITVTGEANGVMPIQSASVVNQGVTADGQVWVTVVATGFGSRAAQRRVTLRAETDGDEPLEPPSFLNA